MKTVHLAVAEQNSTKKDNHTSLKPEKPYLLFIGAADARRSVDDLVAAFNNLRADGNDMQLVLVGENFKSDSYLEKVLPKSISSAILGSSYSRDILKLGYITDREKNELYKSATAFVFPTNYEGFGMPILEAMHNGCPVITYSNSAIPEVAGDNALYARDWNGIMDGVLTIMKMTVKEKSVFISKAKKHADTFSWERTAKQINKSLIGKKK
jgi:glycosyltransferase involved in cell wall biosynthesis